MKNYLIISDDIITINSTIDKILKNNNLKKENIIKYDFNNDSLDTVIEDLNTYGFLVENKVIVYQNVSFLGSNRNKKDNDLNNEEEKEEKTKIDLTPLEKYINNPNPSNILILINDKQDNSKKINKLINDKFTVFNTSISIEDKIKENLEDYKMNMSSIKYLISICSNDNERILNELEKLKMYKLYEKEITSIDIDKTVIKNLDDNIFNLTNSITKKDKRKCIEILDELMLKGEPSIKILIMIADQFRLIYNTKILVGEGKSIDNIAKILDVHSYRIKLASEASYSYTYNQLLSYLIKLGDIDRKIKSTKSNAKLDLQNFLLSL